MTPLTTVVKTTKVLFKVVVVFSPGIVEFLYRGDDIEIGDVMKLLDGNGVTITTTTSAEEEPLLLVTVVVYVDIVKTETSPVVVV